MKLNTVYTLLYMYICYNIYFIYICTYLWENYIILVIISLLYNGQYDGNGMTDKPEM